MKTLLAILLLLLTASGAWGATIVAKPDATNPATAIMYKTGNLTNCSDADGTFTTTGSDLYSAAVAANNSGTLSICAGTYSGTMIRAASAAWIINKTSLTINGAGQASTFIDGTGYATYPIDVQAATPTISNLTIRNAPVAITAIYGRANVIALTDVTFRSNAIPFTLGANATLTRVRVIGNGNTTNGGGSITAGTVNAYYSRWENNSGPLVISGGTTVFNLYNGLDIGQKASAWKANTSGAIMNLYNLVSIAGMTDNSAASAFVAIAGASINVYNSDVLPQGLRPQTSMSSGAGTTTIGATNIYAQPLFVAPRRFGWVSLVVDDSANFSHFKDVATYANSKGVGVVFAAENTDGGISAGDYADMATYVAAGNEIAAHVRYAHSDLTNMSAIAITGKTGTTPTIDIAIMQTDASSANWSGNLLLKEGGSTVKTIAITPATTLANLKTAIDAQSGWSSTINASATTTSKAICLADVTGQSVAAAYTALFEQDKFWYYEIAEHKKALETGIGGGYVVKTFCYPNNMNNATLQAWIATDANFTAAGTTAFLIARGNTTNAVGTYNLNDDVVTVYPSAVVGMQIMNVFNMTATNNFLQATQTRDVDAFATTMAHIGGYGMIYGHGALEYSTALWSSMIDRFLASPGMTIVLPRNAANTIRTAACGGAGTLWADADNTCLRWTRTFTDAEDYHLQETPTRSTLINAGVNVGLTTDYAGTAIKGKPDIGIYESSVAGGGGSGLMLLGVGQ